MFRWACKDLRLWVVFLKNKKKNKKKTRWQREVSITYPRQTLLVKTGRWLAKAQRIQRKKEARSSIHVRGVGGVLTQTGCTEQGHEGKLQLLTNFLNSSNFARHFFPGSRLGLCSLWDPLRISREFKIFTEFKNVHSSFNSSDLNISCMSLNLVSEWSVFLQTCCPSPTSTCHGRSTCSVVLSLVSS